MFGHRLKLRRSLYERLCKAADAGGYADVEEFALHVLEQAADTVPDEEVTDDEIRKRLQGLGYLG